jgi:hypothetical protein
MLTDPLWWLAGSESSSLPGVSQCKGDDHQRTAGEDAKKSDLAEPLWG